MTTDRFQQAKLLLEIEREINYRKEKLDSIASNGMRTLSQDRKDLKKEAEFLEKDLNLATENYLNILDRFAFFIIENIFNCFDLKNDYVKYFRETSKVLINGTNKGVYNNIIKLNELWKKKK